ncbi:MAG: phosphosulfolactate synthase [Alphaproteobacteria bacterium]|jgi:phosphosulfolactate synthase
MTTPFALPPREGKPRKRGLTAMIDFGPDEMGWTGVRGLNDLLECTADYIDYGKIYALNALLLPEGVAAKVAKLYRDYDVTPFAGGILFEYAYEKNLLDSFAAHLKKLNLMGFEISENYITLGDDERRGLIDRFQKDGFEVIYEFGRKQPETPMSIDQLGGIVADMEACGIGHVIVEQSELDMLRDAEPQALDALPKQPWFEKIMIEGDPYQFPKQHADLIKDYGPDVNLANIASGQVLRLEGFRRGVGRAVNYSILDASEGY